MFKRVWRYFSWPKRQVLLNLFLILAAIAGNVFFQVFCIPTPWAAAILVVAFGNTILFPITSRSKKWIAFCSFINGISLFIFMYSILFLNTTLVLSFFLIFFFGLGLIGFVPVFFTFQIIRNNLITPVSKKSKNYFFAGCLTAIILVFFTGFFYAQAENQIEKFKKSNYTELDKNFFTEKILGMHFIYHTRVFLYDGWRPPKHEPLLILGMWLNGQHDPLDVTLEERIALYQKFFPENKIKFDCSCAREYRNMYHNDPIWNSINQ